MGRKREEEETVKGRINRRRAGMSRREKTEKWSTGGNCVAKEEREEREKGTAAQEGKY